MPEKKFILHDNQQIWDCYFHALIDEWNTLNCKTLMQKTYSPKEEQECIKKLTAYKGIKSITPYEFEFIRKKQSIQQYKPVVMSFERFVNKSFNKISPFDVEKFKVNSNQKNRLVHLNAFFLECVSRRIIINPNVDFLISLLPDNYHCLGRRIAEFSQ